MLYLTLMPLLMCSVVINISQRNTIKHQRGTVAYLRERLDCWRANAILRDPRTGRYMKKD